ncbi:hypothetical protein KEJ43_03315 [Candidatus Bathyarchaeota archaeon]|nr:hypothetical protein [Candidatus Bathyarchaeota archaeon]
MSTMVFYIAYKASKENRGLISRRLNALGCRRICSSFWEVENRKVEEALKIIGENQPVLLKRTREIRRPIYDEEGNIIDFGSLLIIVYNAKKDDGRKIRWLLSRTPYIKICRSVYAFCHNNNKYDKKGGLFNANYLFTLMKENDKDAKIFSRMTIIDKDAKTVKMLLDRVRMRIERKTKSILNGYMKLMKKNIEGQIGKRHLTDEEKKLYGKFVALRKMSIFYERWLKLNFSKDLTRIYSIIRKLHTMKT